MYYEWYEYVRVWISSLLYDCQRQIMIELRKQVILKVKLSNYNSRTQEQQIIQHSSSIYAKNQLTPQIRQVKQLEANIDETFQHKIKDDQYTKTTKKQQKYGLIENQNTIQKNQDIKQGDPISLSELQKENKVQINKIPQQKSQLKFRKVSASGNPNHKKILFQRLNYKTEVNNIISQFYQQSFLQRDIQDELLKKHVRQVLGKQELMQEYHILEADGLDHINQFVTIRGDGNCLFTSLMIQILSYYSRMEKRSELNKLIKQTPFNCYLNNLKIQEEQYDQLRSVFQDYIYEFWHNKKPIQDLINNSNESFYGLMVIFIRNLFHQLLQDEDQELHFMINSPENIDKILEWEYMYDETEIALKMFAVKHQFNIKVFSKLNIDQEIFDIQVYKDDNEYQLHKAELGLAFQPGHYNALFLNQLRINNQ